MPKPFTPWKYALIVMVLLLGLLFALPNWYGKSPAVQMRFTATPAEQNTVDRIASLLSAEKIPYKNIVRSAENIDILFAQTDEQIEAKDVLAKHYPDAEISVNLLANTPRWMQALGLDPANLGLDLRGGVSFLLQVDSKELLERRSAELLDTLRATLQEKSLPHIRLENADNGGALVWFQSQEERANALETLYSRLPKGVQQFDAERDGQFGLRFVYSEEAINAAKRRAADQNRMRMASRVNSLGVAEPSVQVVGNDRILIQLPGIQDVSKAKEILGSTATLEFYMVDDKATPADIANAVRLKRPPFGDKLGFFEDGTPILLKRRVVMSGDHIIDASAVYGQGQPQVNVVLDSAGGATMSEITRNNIGKPMATMYVEYLPVEKTDAAGETKTDVEKRETVANSATIQGQFSSNFQITGVTPFERAQKLAATLRAGSLIAPVYIIEERTIGPSAGQQNIDQGVHASLLGLFAIAVFMLVYYNKLGFYSVIALTFNLILLIASISLLGATLTLPGIAGIVLTLGMAVDANVLIYERIREELAADRPIKESIRMGFNGALSSIVDANITTLIVGVLLFIFGAGPIKGFAVTLSVGIMTSMFTAVYVTRALTEFFLLRQAQPTIKL